MGVHCGGALIQHWSNFIVVLTAAHCVDDLRSDGTEDDGLIDQDGNTVAFSIDFGRTKGTDTASSDRTDFQTVNVRKSSEIHVHPNWGNNDADIALIIIEGQDLPSDWPVATIASRKACEESCCEAQEDLTAMGYGLDNDEEEGGQSVQTLEKITMQYHPLEDCTILIGRSLSNAIICAAGNDADVCFGDSV